MSQIRQIERNIPVETVLKLSGPFPHPVIDQDRQMFRVSDVLLASFLVSCLAATVVASDWNRFRGPNGSGVSEDGAVPTEWSETKNLKWKTELPGPGSSSPIVVGDKIFLTCWSGYATDRSNPGNINDLQLHLVCMNRAEGEIAWTQPVDASGKEEEYRGMFAENGYASHTPCSDGERVYAFFGKSGLVAFDLSGKKLWQTSLGTESDRRGWGSASSPILFEEKVIVPATAESEALVALDKKTGEQIWRQEAQGFAGTWGTPVVSKNAEGDAELVLGVPYEVWGFNPENGKLKWYAETVDSDSMCSSVVEHNGIVYTIEGRSGGSAAVKVGGQGNVTAQNVVWSGRDRGRISTPIYFNDRLYWISSGVVNCLDAKTGQEVYQARMQAAPRSGGANAAEPENRNSSGGLGRGGFGGGRGGFGGGQSYSSPVVADGKMYYVNRSGEASVIELGTEYKHLATNKFENDSSDFHATPAISDGQLFLRSNRYLYCISE